MSDLRALRIQALTDRGGRSAKCDSCGQSKPTELHHIFPRGATMGNAEARRLTECKELVAMLCQDCHTGSDNAHNPATATTLLARNIKLYGRDMVKQKYDAVQSAMKHPINIPFPKEEDELTATAMSLEAFYGRAIVDVLVNTQGHSASDEQIQEVAGLSLEQYQIGVNWCKQNGIIDITDTVTND